MDTLEADDRICESIVLGKQHHYRIEAGKAIYEDDLLEEILSEVGSDMERNAYDFESVGGRREEDYLKINPSSDNSQETQPLHDQDYLSFSVIVQVLMNTGMSAFSHLSLGQSVGIVFRRFTFHPWDRECKMLYVRMRDSRF